jgi:hypothetical protein
VAKLKALGPLNLERAAVAHGEAEIAGEEALMSGEAVAR